jgi:hypothetical protein
MRGSANLAGRTRVVWPVRTRTRRLERPLHVKRTVGITRRSRLATEVEILLHGISVGPPALVALECSKRLALMRRDHEIAAARWLQCVLIFVH